MFFFFSNSIYTGSILFVSDLCERCVCVCVCEFEKQVQASKREIDPEEKG